jgi:hypothetical protein
VCRDHEKEAMQTMRVVSSSTIIQGGGWDITRWSVWPLAWDQQGLTNHRIRLAKSRNPHFCAGVDHDTSEVLGRLRPFANRLPPLLRRRCG